ncbi:MAG: DUF4394 domain-containing protein [Janthinobacterium lividum]
MKMLLLAPLLLLAAPGSAQTIYGLGTITGFNFRGAPLNSQAVVGIDPNTGASLNLAPVALTGTAADQLLIGIDFRPADNQLYALGYAAAATGANTQLYVLNLSLNAATSVGTAVRLELGTAADRIGFDFDPVGDQIRVTSTNGANYALSPEDGSLVATGGALAYVGGTPDAALVSAVAYTNAYAGSTSTTLYALDYRNGLLAVQSPPDAGTLAAPQAVQLAVPSGTYGIGEPDAFGLDIYYDPATKTNVGFLAEVTDAALRADGTRASNAYRLDLATGLATQLGNTVAASPFLNFEIRDLAVALPVVALPVELAAFTAVAEGPAAVRLAWATASEKNSAYFAVERSPDGAHFAAVGQVPAAGNSSAARQYAFTDGALPAGAAQLYYRLRQVDEDGAVAYSPVRAVALAGRAAPPGLYPNPAVASTTLVGAPAGAAVQVLDALGRALATATADATGRAELPLPAGLARGVYVVRAGPQALRLLVK